jgi:hypothetical protein
VFTVVRLRGKEPRRIAAEGQRLDEVHRAFRPAQVGPIIAPVEIPIEMRAMADAENEVGIGQRLI